MITSTDFYKADHRNQYPKGTEVVYSNFTPRNNSYAKTDKLTVFGIQAFIIRRLINDFNTKFFNLPKEEAVRKYKRRLDNALGKGMVECSHIEALHDLGYLPLHIKALPEGVEVSMKIPVLTMVNTIPEFFWVTNYLETLTSTELWMPMTSASIAREYRRILVKAAERTGTPLEFVAVQGHDFSMRGMPGLDAAASSGAGHLLSFIGSDTMPAIDFLEEYYGADSDKELVGVSVPATEHSVMCMGEKESEIETFRHLLKMYPAGIVSIVSDTWDFWKVMTEYAPLLEEEIRARKSITSYEFYDYRDPCSGELELAYENGHSVARVSDDEYREMVLSEDGEVSLEEQVEAPTILVPGKTVFRPDSGDPVKILTGYTVYEVPEKYETLGTPKLHQLRFEAGKEAMLLKGKYFCKPENGRGLKELSEAEVKGAVEVLWDTFGGSTTDKGFRQLEEVGLIYGDSITLERAQQIVNRLAYKGFASGNVVLGIGSYTYQYNTRDTYGFAMKATWGQVNGVAREIFKEPKTDTGMKKSAKGLLRVELEDGEYVLYDQQSISQELHGELKTVFLNGKAANFQTLAEIRARVQFE